MASIYDRNSVLSPTAMKTAAERRFRDAEALCNTGDNERAVGAQYLCGFVVEILLKRRLVLGHSVTAKKQQHGLHKTERKIWNLIWRSHDLADMVDALGDQWKSAIEARGQRAGKPFLKYLNDVCSEWTIQARYSSQSSKIAEAREMLQRVEMLKEIL